MAFTKKIVAPVEPDADDKKKPAAKKKGKPVAKPAWKGVADQMLGKQ